MDLWVISVTLNASLPMTPVGRRWEGLEKGG